MKHLSLILGRGKLAHIAHKVVHFAKKHIHGCGSPAAKKDYSLTQGEGLHKQVQRIKPLKFRQ